ncbi:MAG: hypothetical protein ABIQ18_32365 [Umezawaea sp.]
MRATDGNGVELNAKYAVQPDGDHLALVLDSAGGKVTGSPYPRNHQYAAALLLLLERLRDLRAVIVSAVVDSEKVRHLDPALRSLISAPVDLASRTDLEELRLELTSAQGRVGQDPDAPKSGNNSKKIRLLLQVPDYRPQDAGHLEADLAVPAPAAAPAAMDRASRTTLLVSFEGLNADDPVALLWAIGQLVAGHERFFDQKEFHDEVGPLLTTFGPAGSAPEAVRQHLQANTDLWESTGAQFGFTRRAAVRLRNKVFRAQAIDVLRRDHVSLTADFDELLAAVGLTGYDSAQPTALEIVRSLVGKPIRTVNGSPNTVLRVAGGVAVVATDKSPDGKPVPVADVQHGLDLVRKNGSVGVNTDELGSAFVGAVLSTLPGAEVSTRPAMVTLTGPVDIPVPDEPWFDVLDGVALKSYRKEQGKLRQVLLGDRLQAECDLCGHRVPSEFLVAAHIKRRSKCTVAERNDLRNVAMLACTFGCDRLYEFGHVTVDHTGLLVATPAEAELSGLVGEHLRRLHGRRCTAHRPESEPYFAWHRAKFAGS